jgi:hypothetical protein
VRRGIVPGALEERVAALESDVSELRRLFASLAAERASRT